MEKNFIINGQFLTSVFEKVFQRLREGTEIMAEAKFLEKYVEVSGHVLLAPVSIEVNHFVNNFSPSAKYYLSKGDVVSVSIGIKTNDARVKAAYALEIDSEIYKEMMGITSAASKIGIESCKFGQNISEPRHDIYRKLKDGVCTITNVCGYDLYNAMRLIPNTEIIDPTFKQYGIKFKGDNFKEGDVFNIDVYGTNQPKDVHAETFQIPTMYYLTEKFTPMKLKIHKGLYNFVKKKYGGEIFSVARLQEEYKGKMTKKIFEFFLKHQVFIPIWTYTLKGKNPDEQPVSFHFSHTVLIKKTGNILLC